MFSLRALIDRQRKKREGTILADNGEIALLRHDGTASWRFKWGDVREIAAWKDDLITTDIIRLGFRVGDEEECPCCCEEQAGWDELLVVMERVLGVARSDWWERVAKPPFERNWTVLWSTEGRKTGVASADAR